MLKGRPSIVAEISGNHQGNLQRAMMLIRLAAAHGAHAVKIQTYEEDSLTLDCRRDEFMIKEGLWAGQSLYDLYKKAKTPRSFVKPLFDMAKEEDIVLFSSPFAQEDVQVLEDNDCPIYKIASFEVPDLPLIALCAQTRKPLIISTGLASVPEIDRAVETALKHGCTDLTLLHCESHYPSVPSDFNLNTIPFLKERYGCKAGLSDHSLSLSVDIAATALGASLIEKHFIDDRSIDAVDAPFSLMPDELSKLVEETAEIAGALGQKDIVLKEKDLKARPGRRSAYLVRNLNEGEVLTQECVRIVRPGLGLEPYKLPNLWGKKAVRALEKYTPVSEEDFA